MRWNVRYIDTVSDELRGEGQRSADDVKVLSPPAMNSPTYSGDANSACQSYSPTDFTRCAFGTAKTQRPSPRPTSSFHCHWNRELFRRGGLLSSDVAEVAVAEVSVAEIGGEVAALQPRLHCDEESGRIRTVDDAVIVRESEVHH